MTIRDLMKLSTRMFKARTSRTLLTILGMGVGISAILFLVGLGYGIQRTLLETISTADSLLSLDVYPDKENENISQTVVSEIESIPEVVKVNLVFETNAQIKFNEFISDSKAVVIDRDFLNLDGTKIVEGRGISDEFPEGIVVSETFAKVFNKAPSEMIGEKLRFSLAFPDSAGAAKKTRTVDIGKDFEVIGFTENKENVIYINSESLKELSLISSYSRLKVKCARSEYLASVREKMTGMGLSVSSVSDVIKEADKAFAIVRIILAFFGMIALLVSAIGMFNTMTVTLLERTEEIGIMKSIGASDFDILWMFVFESTVMGFLGGIFGIIIGITNSQLFNLMVNVLAKSLGGSPISLFYFPLWFLGAISVSATVVGFFTGLVPAKRASSIDPLDALRYK